MVTGRMHKHTRRHCTSHKRNGKCAHFAPGASRGNPWYDNTPGHSRAAKKGARRVRRYGGGFRRLRH